ncbi:short chain dehydrogenase family protein [Myriangium duriaei CBS 260.36]|uniref:Short chain dehydrogenase family protein n=1 Tax=Myriangium duriaei CBS 260.36 TaxID=1168546 RepID=A0A9P4JD22_9PEZI|nr:short chain dehydrogenase family protein [Myriangium duriaei CBS 260.36]
MSTAPKVALIVGASRGIGRQIAVDLARNGYKVAVAAKTTSDSATAVPFPPDPNSSQSTINTVQREIQESGGHAIAVKVDVRDADSVRSMVDQVELGRLDVLIYNSGAIWWSSVAGTPMQRFRLMQRVNPEGLYAAIQASLPHFETLGWNGRVIVISPPIYSRFFRGKAAYAMGKVAMSVLTIGLAMDWERQGHSNMAITSLWPAAAIQSAATRDMDNSLRADLRKATIFSDAVLAILELPPSRVNGKLEVDEDLLRREMGITDFSRYSLVPGSSPRRIMPSSFPDLTVPEQDDEGQRRDSNNLRAKM